MGQTIWDLCRAIGGRLMHGDSDAMATTNRVRFLSAQEAGRVELREQLAAQGVTCIVVKDLPDLEIWGTFAIILVNSLATAYHLFAAWHRQNLRMPVVQVIGSMGKSTTKEMIGATLQQLTPLVGETSDPDGVAWSLLRANKGHQAAVVAAGTSQSGVMQLTSRMLCPDVLVVTSVQRSPDFASLEATIAALAEAIPSTNPRGLLLINRDDVKSDRFPVKRFSGKVLSYGYGDWQDVFAQDVRVEGWRTSFTARLRDLAIHCTINAFDRYNVSNALAAVYVGHHLGLAPEAIATGLASWRPSAGRKQMRQCRDGMIYIDDSHRASLESMLELLRALAKVDRQYKQVLVLGDMLGPDESAEQAAAAHYAAGLEVAKLAPTRFIAIGQWASEYMRGAKAGGLPEERVRYFAKSAEAEDWLLSVVEPASLVVFKGDDRWTKLGRLVELLGERP